MENEYTPEEILEAEVQELKDKEEKKKHTALIPMGSTAIAPIESREAASQTDTTIQEVSTDISTHGEKAEHTNKTKVHIEEGAYKELESHSIVLTEEYLRWRHPYAEAFDKSHHVTVKSSKTGERTAVELTPEQYNNIEIINSIVDDDNYQIEEAIGQGIITNPDVLPILAEKQRREQKRVWNLETGYKPLLEGDPEAIFTDCLERAKKFTHGIEYSDDARPVEYVANWIKIGRAYQDKYKPAPAQPSINTAPAKPALAKPMESTPVAKIAPPTPTVNTAPAGK